MVIDPKIQQEICGGFQKSGHFTVSKKCSLLQITVSQGDPSDLSVCERMHLALHHPTTKANKCRSGRANSWAALTEKAKNGNLVPLLTLQHQIPFSCPISLRKSKQVSTAPGCTQRQEPLFRRSNIPNFSPAYTKSSFVCPLPDGAPEFFLPDTFSRALPDHWLFRAQHISNGIFLSYFYCVVCSRSHSSKVRISEDIKSDPQKMPTC